MSSRKGDEVPNVCAGRFGVIYDFYIERPWLMRTIARVFWGIDASVFYASMAPIEGAAAGATIVDVPCGGGVALRALSPDQDVRYIAADLSPKMLERAARRAQDRSLKQVETVVADMTDLPFADAEADLLVSYNGLHMLEDPGKAIHEFARCLKPGGQLIGTTFFSDGSRRAQKHFKLSTRSGHPGPPNREHVQAALVSAGFEEPTIGPQPGFAAFSGRKAR